MVRMLPVRLALATTLAVTLYSLAHTVYSADSNSASTVELAMWEYAVSTGKIEEVERFLQLYPNSEFTEAALKLKETLAANTATSADQQNTTAGPVNFDTPLATDTSDGAPRSIKQLAAGNPLFPPIADLPAEYWESKNCSDCHAWNRDNLCEQANFLANREAEAVQRIRHPYGGFFKDALREWAASGCL